MAGGKQGHALCNNMWLVEQGHALCNNMWLVEQGHAHVNNLCQARACSK